MDNKARRIKLDFLYTIFTVNGQLCISVVAFAKLFHYHRDTVHGWIQKKKLKAFKYRRFWYIILPPIAVSKRFSIIKFETPSGREMTIDWQDELIDNPSLPGDIVDFLSNLELNLNPIIFNGDKYLDLDSPGDFPTSSLSAKSEGSFKPLNQGRFKATLDYRYGYYIIYDPTKMSTFAPGTAGTLKATTIPSAFFEICRALDAAEQSRNGANPGLPAKRNLSTTISFDTGTIGAAATIPINQIIDSSGVPTIVASDYLGSTYSTFANGSGDLNSTNLITAFLELAGILAAAEKLVTPAADQPNNIQVTYDLEAGSATVSANLPFNTSGTTTGDVTIHAIDYL